MTWGDSPPSPVFASMPSAGVVCVGKQTKSQVYPACVVKRAQSCGDFRLDRWVYGFRRRLYEVGKLAKTNLATFQRKMKKLFDHRAEKCVFRPGDKVLAFLPLVDSPFHAKFEGPYAVVADNDESNER